MVAALVKANSTRKHQRTQNRTRIRIYEPQVWITSFCPPKARICELARMTCLEVPGHGLLIGLVVKLGLVMVV